MLISSGGIDLKREKQNRWKSHSFLPFEMLHKRYRFLLIKHLKENITHYLRKHPEEKGELKVFRERKVLDAFFDPFLKINWYVYDSTNLKRRKVYRRLYLRYAKRAALAECRISQYGQRGREEGSWVTFTYKERGASLVECTISLEKFITLLIQHILPPNFRVVRYSGLLSSRLKARYEKITHRLLRKEAEREKLRSWRERQILFTGKDPLVCPICKIEMKLVEVAFFSSKEEKIVVYEPP